MTITVYVGDTTNFLAEQAHLQCTDATLVSMDNFQKLNPGNVYYASIGDLASLNNFAEVLRQADIIIYAPPDKWTDDHDSKSMMQYWTESYLSVFCSDPAKTVIGFDIPSSNKTEMLSLVDTRKSNNQQIWIAGCSISHGDGVEDHERYGELISKELNLPATFLTASGASIRWASDQLLRSDIRSDDIIFWGISSLHRLSYWNEYKNKIHHVVLSNFDKNKFLKFLVNEKYLASDHMIYDSLVSIYNVLNFCKKNNVTLIIATLLEGMEIYSQGIVNFVPLAGIHGKNIDDRYLDLGTDNAHPGPKSHQFYKEKMLEVYYQTNQKNK